MTDHIQPGDWIAGPFWEAPVQVITRRERHGSQGPRLGNRVGPGAPFVIVYGCRRVGKTTLLTTWADQTGLPTLYWVANRDPKEALMANLARTIYEGASRALELSNITCNL